MARYAIGDIQGCYKQFMQLLDLINFNPSKDVLYLVGDLVNRGPQSLEVLKWVYRNQDSVINVLGNHDFYLLARFHHLVKLDAGDTLADTIRDKHINKYIDWLRSCPLVYHDNQYILVHAGIYPRMDFNELLHIRHSISNHLRSNDYPQFIESIFGNKPNYWNADHDSHKKMKFVINACTRMRFLEKSDFSLDYKFKGDLGNMPEHLVPWFQAGFDPSINKKIVFGHWAALGFFHDHNYISLDTGCVWGRKLTAINLENHELAQVMYSAD
jgi:bis(5'-nucleosyl)-tetraphosphatase (symmetrical)